MKIKKREINSKLMRCLGPIDDLEPYLTAEWWKGLFNATYLKTDGDVVENEDNTEKDIELLLDFGRFSQEDAILDLCCGQGRHLLALAKRSFGNLTGMDRSRFLIRVAKKRSCEFGFPNIKFSEGDARKIKAAQASFDRVMIMGNSFGYFESPQDDERVLSEVLRTLKSEGALFLDVTEGEWMARHFNPRSWEWIDEKTLVCRERSLATDRVRLISREVVIHIEKGVLVDQFYAERLYTFEALQALLSKVGFEGIEKHKQLSSISSRNQDLGMMEHRLLVTAKAPKKAPLSALPMKQKVQCTVILGDPTLPDPVKLGGKFNPEDHFAVEKLKEALLGLEGFSFAYFDRHATLLADLQKGRPSFVFNLCDEGFMNDPAKELHIVALLDMLGVRYTGSKPATLALCYNKAHVRNQALAMHIRVPEEVQIPYGSMEAPTFTDFPALVKPALGDGSIGITKESVVTNFEELVQAVDRLKRELPKTPLLVQEFLCGREFSVGLIGNRDDLFALPILEVDYSELPEELPQILGYESKWDPSSPYWTKIKYKQAQLSEEQERQLVQTAKDLFYRFECQDYARIDFREDGSGVIKLLEINPNASLCFDGKFNLMAQFRGLSYSDLLQAVVKAAWEREKESV